MNETMGMSYASLYYAEVGKNNELQKDNKQLKDLCDKYEEEHKTTFEEWKKDIKANKKAIEYINVIKENTPSSTRKDYAKMILINYENLLNILQGVDKE